MATRDTVIGAAGALIIVTAIIGVVVIEGRAGPYVHDLAPEAPGIPVEGSYRATAGEDPLGLPGGCTPVPPLVECPAPSMEIDILVAFDAAESGIHLVAFVTNTNGHRALGALEPQADGISLTHSSSEDLTAYTDFVLHVELDPDAASPNGPVVYRRDLGTDPRERRATLDGQLEAPLPAASGTIRLTQIGAVSVSALASGTLTGVAAYDGFVYRAWLEKDGSHIYLGEYRFSDATAQEATIDVRVERARVEDKRFLVTLEPVTAATTQPVGMMVAVAVA